MSVTADQERVKTLLTETIILLCKNGLHFKNEFTVEGLIGITIDKKDVFLINIKETIQIGSKASRSPAGGDVGPHPQKQRQRKRRHELRTPTNPNYESDTSDHDNQKRNANCNELHSSACFSNSSSSPIQFVVQSQNTQVDLPRTDHEEPRVEVASTNLHNPLNCLDVPSKDRNSDCTGASEHAKDSSSPDQTPFSAVGLSTDEPKTVASESFANSRGECDSNFFPLRVKEELPEVDEINQCRVVRSPVFSTIQNTFPPRDGPPNYSGIKYSPVDSSVSAYNPISHQTFQAYHGADQSSFNDQQVELLPGSGVYISMRAYVHLNKETWVRGSKLVRRVVREVFPDEHILARSSCLGRRLGGCHVGLDHHKVDTIKAFVQQRMPQVSHTEIVAAINECCRDIRAKLRKSYFRRSGVQVRDVKDVQTLTPR